MIIQDIHLDKYDWNVRVYYALDTYYIEDILEDLMYIGCSSEELFKVEDLFDYNYKNRGFTFTNSRIRSSIIIIGKTTSAEEFQNTFDHEKGHLAMHISQTLDIDVYGEEYQYLTGEIGKQMFKVAKLFLCNHCRKKLFRSYYK